MNIRQWGLALALGLLASVPVYPASQSTLDKVQQIYVAYYGRPADPGGLNWWADELEKNDGRLKDIINEFGASEEYNTRFGSLSTSQLLSNLYQQMFGRTAEQSGLDWWREQIDAGTFTLGEAALAIAEGAQDGDAPDRTTLTKRTQVAQTFTSQIEAQSKAYTLGNVPQARDLIMGVNASTDVNSFASSTSFTRTLTTMPAGGDSGIKTVHAEVTAENSTNLGVAAARGIKKSISNVQTQNRTSGFVGVGSVAPTGFTFEIPCDSGSSIFSSDEDDGSASTMVYDNCVTGSEIYNGSIYFAYEDEGLTSSIEFDEFMMYDIEEAYSLTMDGYMYYELSSDMSTATTIFENFSYRDSYGEAYFWEYAVITCSGLDEEDGGDCEFDEAQFVDAWTGETYYIEDDEVTEVSGGYQVSTKVYDTDYGWVDVTTSSNLMLGGCDNGMFSAGTLKVEGADGSAAEVNFVDCNSFTVTVNGVSELLSWEQFKRL